MNKYEELNQLMSKVEDVKEKLEKTDKRQTQLSEELKEIRKEQEGVDEKTNDYKQLKITEDEVLGKLKQLHETQSNIKGKIEEEIKVMQEKWKEEIEKNAETIIEKKKLMENKLEDAKKNAKKIKLEIADRNKKIEMYKGFQDKDIKDKGEDAKRDATFQYREKYIAQLEMENKKDIDKLSNKNLAKEIQELQDINKTLRAQLKLINFDNIGELKTIDPKSQSEAKKQAEENKRRQQAEQSEFEGAQYVHNPITKPEIIEKDQQLGEVIIMPENNKVYYKHYNSDEQMEIPLTMGEMMKDRKATLKRMGVKDIVKQVVGGSRFNPIKAFKRHSLMKKIDVLPLIAMELGNHNGEDMLNDKEAYIRKLNGEEPRIKETGELYELPEINYYMENTPRKFKRLNKSAKAAEEMELGEVTGLKKSRIKELFSNIFGRDKEDYYLDKGIYDEAEKKVIREPVTMYDKYRVDQEVINEMLKTGKNFDPNTYQQEAQETEIENEYE